MAIHIITIGKKMPNWVSSAVDHYQKLLLKYEKIKWSTLEIKKNKNLSQSEIIALETEALEQNLPKDSICVCLDSKGKMLDSEGLAYKINTWKQQQQHICFIIGGPFGLHPKLVDHCDFHWSYSNLTFPHMLMRILLLEQLYRAHSVLNNHPYHQKDTLM